MKVLKRIVFFIIVCVLLMPSYVNALEDDQGFIYPEDALPEVEIHETDESFEDPEARATRYRGSERQLLQDMEGRVKEAILNGKSRIDLYSEGIDVSKYTSLAYIQYYSPYLSKINVTAYMTPSKIFTCLIIDNPFSINQTKAYFNKVDAKLEDIYKQINTDYTNEQIALTVHDYLASHFMYDVKGSTGNEKFSAGGLLYNGIGVCNGYAYLYDYLMHKYNIDCYVTGSVSMNHAWNIICLNNRYYHVDCTWDDPIYINGVKSDAYGQVQHTYFLKSDSGFKNHSGWDRTDLACSSTKYDNYYWKSISSPIVIKGSYAYYIEYNTQSNKNLLIKRNLTNNVKKTLYSFEIWNNSYSFSGLFINENNLYFNTPTTINRFSLQTNKNEIVYNNTANKYFIYGSVQRGENIGYVLKQKPQDINKERLVNSNLTVASYLYFDKQSMMLSKGQKYQLSYHSSESPLQWKSSNSAVALVDSTGRIKAVNTGSTVITITASSGKKATCKVTVPYTVKYNLNGGTNNKSNPTSYYGKKITLQNPTRKGYVFAGWYSDSKFKTKVTSFSSGNKTLYAKWNKVSVSKAKTPTLTNIETRKLKVSYTAISGVKGYQIQYGTNSKFKGSKTKYVTSRSYTLTSLIKGKRYYVRVRGYKLDSTGNKVYGSWSSVKNIKISK